MPSSSSRIEAREVLGFREWAHLYELAALGEALELDGEELLPVVREALVVALDELGDCGRAASGAVLEGGDGVGDHDLVLGMGGRRLGGCFGGHFDECFPACVGTGDDAKPNERGRLQRRIKIQRRGLDVQEEATGQATSLCRGRFMNVRQHEHVPTCVVGVEGDVFALDDCDVLCRGAWVLLYAPAVHPVAP